MNVGVGNLFYGTEGWAAMSDRDSRRTRAIERTHHGGAAGARCGDVTGLHMQNFLACVKSRKEKDLHDPLVNAVPSADCATWRISATAWAAN